LPTGLFVIGSGAEIDGERRCNLMTATLVMQVATDPKLVAVSIDADAVTHDLVSVGGRFSVCLVAREDRAVVRRFVKPVDPTSVTVDAAGRVTAMAGEPVFEAATGAPILRRSPAWLDCAVRHHLDFPSHTLFVGEVMDVGGPDGDVPDVLRREDTRMNYGG
jgi:flavin reductase (DIM6/NTAB) family NADH-FMN oxidoreductase RutF